jgi:hypothetical protein
MSWIEFTCGECGDKYTENTGDTDERVCYECLDKEECPGWDVDSSEDGQHIVACDHKTKEGLKGIPEDIQAITKS